MSKILAKLYRIFSGLWLGSILFFSGVIAPQIFRHLPKADAAGLQNHLFPIYYAVGIFCGFALLTLDFLSKRKKLLILLFATLIALIGFFYLSPQIREAYLSQSLDMKWLHPLAVALNILMLVLVLIAV